MTVQLGAGIFDRPVLIEPEPEPDRWAEVLFALYGLQQAITNLPAPEVHVAAPDLAQIVTAIQGLRPNATAAELAEEVRKVIVPGPPPPVQESVAPALEAVKDVLERLEFRMGAFSGGGGGPSNDGIESRLAAIRDRLPNLTGTWDYRAGVSGTPTLPAGCRVIGITAHATTAGSMTIDGGDSIPIPANTSPIFMPQGELIAPALVFTGTDSYVVEVLT